jgi:hypothetical protein
MWRNIKINEKEYEELNQIAEFIVDNEFDVFRKLVRHNPSFKILGSAQLQFFPTKIDIYDYINSSYSLIHSIVNMNKIIEQWYDDYETDETEKTMKTSKFNHIEYNRKYLRKHLKNEQRITNTLSSFMFSPRMRARYGILPITFVCTYNKDIEDNEESDKKLFSNYHSNAAVFDRETKSWTLVEPHGEINLDSKKIISCIKSLKQYISNFEEYEYIPIQNFTIPVDIPKGGTQGEDYLCVSWTCFLVNYMINGDIGGNLYNEHIKRHNIVKFLKKVKSLYKNINMKLNPLDPEILKFLPSNYLKSYHFLEQLLGDSV